MYVPGTQSRGWSAASPADRGAVLLRTRRRVQRRRAGRAERGQRLSPAGPLRRGAHSAEGALGHDGVELVRIDLAVLVGVGAVDHLKQLGVGHGLAKLLGNALEVLERDLAGLVVVKELEHLANVLTRVLVGLGKGGRGVSAGAAAGCGGPRRTILAVIMSRNSSKSMEPDPSLSMSPIIW